MEQLFGAVGVSLVKYTMCHGLTYHHPFFVYSRSRYWSVALANATRKYRCAVLFDLLDLLDVAVTLAELSSA